MVVCLDASTGCWCINRTGEIAALPTVLSWICTIWNWKHDPEQINKYLLTTLLRYNNTSFTESLNDFNSYKFNPALFKPEFQKKKVQGHVWDDLGVICLAVSMCVWVCVGQCRIYGLTPHHTHTNTLTLTIPAYDRQTRPLFSYSLNQPTSLNSLFNFLFPFRGRKILKGSE